MENLLVSVSGGKTSWRMAQWIKENWSDQYNLLYAFANTGKERKETIEFNILCSKYFEINLHWIEAIVHYGERKGCTHKIVKPNNYSKNGEPFHAVIKKYGIPNVAFPHCTRELKANPLRSFAKEYFNGEKFKIAIGIRVDEIDRVTNDKNKLYPLVSPFPMNKKQINDFWDKMPFNLMLKSYEGNCDLCFKKTLRKLLTIISEDRNVSKWWNDTEKAFEYFNGNRKKSKPPYRFNRNNLSVDELIKLSCSHFEKAKDENEIKLKYKQLELFNLPMDISNGCIESCEPF